MAKPKIKKKYVVAGLIGVVSLVGAGLYLQAKKLIDNFNWTVKKVKVRTINPALISFDLFFDFINASNVDITIVSQQYKIYINDAYVSRGSNGDANLIAKESQSELGVNIQFDPKVVFQELKLNAMDMVLKPDSINIKVDMKFRLKIWLFSFNVPYVYNVDLKELKSWYIK